MSIKLPFAIFLTSCLLSVAGCEFANAQEAPANVADACLQSIDETEPQSVCPKFTATEQTCANIEAKWRTILDMSSETRAALAKVQSGELPIENQFKVLVLAGEAQIIMITALGARDLCNELGF